MRNAEVNGKRLSTGLAWSCVCLLLAGAGLVACGPGQKSPDVIVVEGDVGGWQVEEDTGRQQRDTGVVEADTGRVDTGRQMPGKTTGEACTSSEQCQGDTCMTIDGYPGGYCTSIGCRDSGCSGQDAVCVEFRGGSTGCLDGCRRHEECRDGYSCQEASPDGTMACLPGEPPPPTTFAETKKILGVECSPTNLGETHGGTRWQFDFQLTDKATGFLMVPMVTADSLRPTTLTTPDGKVDLVEGYKYHNSRVSDAYRSGGMTGIGTFGEIAMDWPILVPYAPRHEEMVVPGGRYQLEVTAVQTPCLYVVENRPGATLDLNLYFVGAGDLDARTARLDEDLGEVMKRFEHIYAKAGVKLDKVRYFDLPTEVVDRYRRVTSRADAQRLMAYGEPPSNTRDGHLSIDVFLVQDLKLRQDGQGDVLGMSAGLPGAAGMHGNARNGLVFQTSDLGFDNDHVAHIMAHEIGHFLGLRHTTEVVHDTDRGARFERILGTTDPIRDTEICPNILDKLRSNPRSCQDFDNLMFPVAPPSHLNVDPRLTDGQTKAMRANPLIQE